MRYVKNSASNSARQGLLGDPQDPRCSLAFYPYPLANSHWNFPVYMTCDDVIVLGYWNVYLSIPWLIPFLVLFSGIKN
jgi:hypothetical protein